jgi:type VI protein secretion system component Hcp
LRRRTTISLELAAGSAQTTRALSSGEKTMPSMSRRFSLLTVFAVCAFTAVSAHAEHAESEFVMRIAGIEGESQQEAGAIDVLSFSWGIQAPSTPVGGGGGVGKVTFQDLTFTKKVDKASAALMRSCATGQHLPELTLVARKAGGKQQEYLVVTLKRRGHHVLRALRQHGDRQTLRVAVVELRKSGDGGERNHHLL